MATATLKRKAAKVSYDEVEAALRNGKNFKVRGRQGKVAARCYFLDDDQVTKLVTAREAGKSEKDRLPNPFHRGFAYYLWEALTTMGANKNYKYSTVQEKFKEVASTADSKDENGKTFWYRFKNRPMRNKDTGRDWEGRFEQNIEVLQRLGGVTPYGRPLIQYGQKVLGTKGVTLDVVLHPKTREVMLRLNTDNDKPVNQTKRGQKPEKATPVAETPAPEVVQTAPVTAPVAEVETIAPVAEPVTVTETPVQPAVENGGGVITAPEAGVGTGTEPVAAPEAVEATLS